MALGAILVSDSINLIKLCVGAESVESQIAWQKAARKKMPGGLPRHVTRMWPKRSDELLNGGSLYWVIKGMVQCRQRIVRLDEVIGHDGIRRCGIVFDPRLFAPKARSNARFRAGAICATRMRRLICRKGGAMKRCYRLR